MSSIRTRSGRVSKPPERLEIFEEVELDLLLMMMKMMKMRNNVVKKIKHEFINGE